MKFRQAIAAAALAASGVLAISSVASAATIASASFEVPVLGPDAASYGPDHNFYSNPDQYVSPNVPGFTFDGYSGIISNSYVNALPVAPDGTQAAFIQFYVTPPSGSIGWTVNGFNPGALYTLSFYAAGSALDGVGVNPFDITFVGATTADTTSFTPLAGLYQYNSLSFTATAASVTIGFIGTGTSGNLVTGLDDLLITSAVPEPATWAMMLLGFGGIGFMLRNRRKLVTA